MAKPKKSKIESTIRTADPTLGSTQVQDLTLRSEKLIRRARADKNLLPAIGYAVQNHAGQKRKSGEPYAVHPIEVAYILADNDLDTVTVIAGLFHDLIEDCEITQEDIITAYPDIGETVAFLVEGVTKIAGVVDDGGKKKRDYAGYQKLIIASATDVRVLVIKLADRIHNLRTIQFLRKTRKEKIAEETLHIYAPLAHRVGMTKIKTELEDRSLAILEPGAYAEANLLVEAAKKTGAQKLKQMEAEIQKALKQEKINSVISSRVKSLFSISEKLKRYPDNKDYLLEDILGIRIIVDSINECYLALGIVHGLYPPKTDSFDDYIALARSNLYQSLHTAVLAPFGDDKKIIEVQIRTQEMDDIAERGIAAHWRYKEVFRKKGVRPEIDLSITAPEGDLDDAAELEVAFQQLKQELLFEETYCFTPEGEAKFLPQGANAIDFAYSLHSDLGDQIVGARTNGALYPITKPLPNGSVVEIIVNKKSSPSLAWLDSVKTPRAKQRIRHFHNSGINPARRKQLYGFLRSDLREAGFLKQSSLSEEQLLAYLRDQDDGEDDVLLSRLEEKKFRDLIVADVKSKLAEQIKTNIEQKPRRSQSNDSPMIVLIEGNADIKHRIAKCCHPEPGDEIVAYVSRSKEIGTTIHKKRCKNILALIKNHDPEPVPGLIEAKFGSREEVVFQSKISLKLKDRPGLLSDLTKVVYRSGAEIINIELRSKMGIVRGHILCKVAGQKAADNLRQEIQLVDGFLEGA